MALIVAKFGGTSVADVGRIKLAAAKVAAEVALGHQVAVVVSAMSGVTDNLVAEVAAVGGGDEREHDAVVATGEQVTAGLMALALQNMGVKARSWQAWQVAVETDSRHGAARILDIDVAGLRASLENGEVAVMAGFQGVEMQGERITTLGRGGSDTSAVALAVALKADRCDIYTDVRGVLTVDPRITDKAQLCKKLGYEEMIELSSVGAKVLHTRAILMALREKMPVQVLSSFDDAIGSELLGTLILDEEELMEKQTISGIACSRDEAKITLIDVPDEPGIAAKILKPLADSHVHIDMIVQNISTKGQTDLTCVIPEKELDIALKALENAGGLCADTRSEIGVTKISLIGIGLRSHPEIASLMFETLAEKGVNIQVISTSELRISVLIDDDYTELAVRSLHTAFGLDEA